MIYYHSTTKEESFGSSFQESLSNKDDWYFPGSAFTTITFGAED